MKNSRLLFGAALLLSLTGLTSCKPEVTEPDVETPTFRTETVLTGYGIIWGMDFLPNGDLLFTEKSGKLRRFSNGTATEITGLPSDIDTRSQGGLLDLRVHPQYAANGWVYASYAGSVSGSSATRLNLIRFKISNTQITNLETIFQTAATNTWQGHYGSRIEFDNSGFLYLSVGEGGARTLGGESSPNKNAQDLTTGWGKVHRMTDSGQVPTDNPVLAGQSDPTTIYSYGHRNPQGLAINPATNELWETEHGPQGGDEINIVQRGANYGWPLVSNGINYDGSTISASPTRDGIQAPLFTWTPSIGTSGLAFITSDNFGSWKGSLATGALASEYLSICQLNNNQVVSEAKLLQGEGRVRNVKQGPNGNLYVAIESPGRIIQIIPE
jgi:glucose/arabinose dehydrogenase